jgi:hypothetical protein
MTRGDGRALEKRSVSKDDYPARPADPATGGFAGLMRAGFQHADKLAAIQAQTYPRAVELAAARLSAEPNVQAECHTILRALTASEIATLYDAAQGKRNLNQTLVDELTAKSLLQPTDDVQGLRIHPPGWPRISQQSHPPSRCRPAAAHAARSSDTSVLFARADKLRPFTALVLANRYSLLATRYLQAPSERAPAPPT